MTSTTRRDRAKMTWPLLTVGGGGGTHSHQILRGHLGQYVHEEEILSSFRLLAVLVS